MEKQKSHSRVCAVVSCRNNSTKNKGCSFFGFPKDTNRLKLWINNSQRTDLLNKDLTKLSKTTFMCNKHFEKRMFLNDLENRLHEHAVPTIFTTLTQEPSLPHVMHTIDENGEENLFGNVITESKGYRTEMQRSESIADISRKHPPFHANPIRGNSERFPIKNTTICDSPLNDSIRSGGGIKRRLLQPKSRMIPIKNLTERIEIVRKEDAQIDPRIFSHGKLKENVEPPSKIFEKSTPVTIENSLSNEQIEFSTLEELEDDTGTDLLQNDALSDGMAEEIVLDPGQDVSQETICAVDKLCRLCFGVGSIDLFKCKYLQKSLKEIVELFVPIEIKQDDISTVICRSCNSELIRFYDFFLKSLQMNDHFQALKEDIHNNKCNSGDGNVHRLTFIHSDELAANDDVKEFMEVIDDTVEEVNNEIATIELSIPEMDSPEQEEPSSLLRQCLLAPSIDVFKEVDKAKYDIIIASPNHVPENVMKYIHSYASTRLKKTKVEDHGPILKCPECDQIFKTEKELVSHNKDHGKECSYVCEQCGEFFSTQEILKLHLKYIHEEKECIQKCLECPKTFADEDQLELHMRLHKDNRRFCCEQCGAFFTTFYGLRKHQTMHLKKSHQCVFCNKGFDTASKLSMHLPKHTGEQRYTCEQCDISYLRQVNLYRHNRKYHLYPEDPKDVLFQACPVCNLPCKHPNHLRMHMLRKHKTYTCAICDVTFKNYQKYYVHTYKHFPNKKKFLCSYCDKRFSNSHLRNVHMTVHTGKKEFECELCDKKFSQRPHLKSHLLIHTGERPHKCKYCVQSFAHLSTLVVHERIHTGETPYVCQFCNKGFGHLTNYKKHVLSQHGVVVPKQRDYSKVVKVKEEAEDDGTGENVDEEDFEPMIVFNIDGTSLEESREEIVDDENVMYLTQESA